MSMLSKISGITFTKREIDVLSCLLHNRWEKKIAQILLISPRTVETHINNIKMKLSGCSREQIIDFLESSGRIEEFRRWYGDLLINNVYTNTLNKINKSLNIKCKVCCIVDPMISHEGENLIKTIKTDIIRAGGVVVKASNDIIKINITEGVSNSSKDLPFITLHIDSELGEDIQDTQNIYLNNRLQYIIIA